MKTVDKAKLCLEIIKERKAIQPLLLDVENLTSITDFFIITSGSSTRQVQAIARHLQKELRDAGFRPLGMEGEQEGKWVLMDYGDVVIHIFYQPMREFYNLEGLWIEATEVSV
jgi:ribosome-associated protein